MDRFASVLKPVSVCGFTPRFSAQTISRAFHAQAGSGLIIRRALVRIQAGPLSRFMRSPFRQVSVCTDNRNRLEIAGADCGAESAPLPSDGLSPPQNQHWQRRRKTSGFRIVCLQLIAHSLATRPFRRIHTGSPRLPWNWCCADDTERSAFGGDRCFFQRASWVVRTEQTRTVIGELLYPADRTTRLHQHRSAACLTWALGKCPSRQPTGRVVLVH